jgi:hypothetical protein
MATTTEASSGGQDRYANRECEKQDLEGIIERNVCGEKECRWRGGRE